MFLEIATTYGNVKQGGIIFGKNHHTTPPGYQYTKQPSKLVFCTMNYKQKYKVRNNIKP